MAGARTVTRPPRTSAIRQPYVPGSTRRTGRRGQRVGDRGEVRDVELLAAQRWDRCRPPRARPGRPRATRPTRPGPSAASCAAGRTPRRCRRTPPRARPGSGGGSRRVRATSPLSTLGGGQKTERPTAPARRTSAYHAALTLGTPYVRDPGGGGQPVRDLGLDHDQAPAQRRQPLEQGQQHGHGHVVGQVGHERRGELTGQVLGLEAAGHPDRGRPTGRAGPRGQGGGPPPFAAARRRARGRSRRRRPGGRRPAGPGSASRDRDRPRGPRRPDPTPATRTMRRTVFGSMTKFCPSDLVGRTPRRSASARTSAGPSKPSSTPED